jgi:putative SOS response-associated peptidase YedK
MCGRFTLRCDSDILAEYFDVPEVPPLESRYNIAPTQGVLVVRVLESGGPRTADFLRWGLVPSWADDPKAGYRMINARAETVPKSPAYRTAFRKRRCVLAADGFFEWRKEGKKKKKPSHFTLADGEPFGIAGLWERWEKGETPLETCTLLTTEANSLVRPLHDRMPVILPPEHLERWLDPKFDDLDELMDLLQPFPAKQMRHVEVSTRVNFVKNDDPECLEPETE